jgi:hypothetical protein
VLNQDLGIGKELYFGLRMGELGTFGVVLLQQSRKIQHAASGAIVGHR